MKFKVLLKGILPLSIMLLSATPCDAQLNKLLRKAKNAVEKTTKKSTNEDQNEAAQAGVDQEEKHSKKTLKPSEEVLAADPNANNTQIDKGFTKSIGEIHATYLHLNKKDFPYQPYYKYKQFYRMDDSKLDGELMNYFSFALKHVLTTPDLSVYNVPYETFVMEDGTKTVIPIDERWRHAYTAVYLADPKSTAAFKSYSWVLLFQKQFLGQLNYHVEDKQTGVVDSKSGSMLPWVDFYTKRWNREEKALAKARSVTNFDEIVALTDTWFSACESATDSYEKYWYYQMGFAILQHVVEKHDDYLSTDPGVRKVTMKFKKLQQEAYDLQLAVIANHAPGQPLPAGVAVSGEIKTKGTAAAQAYAGEKFVKVVFLKNNWETFKEQKWPYRITAYRIPIVVVTKEGGKLLQQPCDLQKSPSGNTYNVVAGMSGAKVPVTE